MRSSNNEEDDERFRALCVVVLLVTLPLALSVAALVGNVSGHSPVPPPDEARVQCSTGEPYNVSEMQSHSLSGFFSDSTGSWRYALNKQVKVEVTWIVRQIACSGRQGRVELLTVMDGLGTAEPGDVRAALLKASEKPWRNETRWLYPWCTGRAGCLRDEPYEPPMETTLLNWLWWLLVVLCTWFYAAFGLFLSGYLERQDRTLLVYRQLVRGYRVLVRRESASTVV